MRIEQLTILTVLLLANSGAYAVDTCPIPVITEINDQNQVTKDIVISADQARGAPEKWARFEGNVEILNGASKMSANVAFLDAIKQKMAASEQIRYQSNGISVDGDEAAVDFKQGAITFDNTHFEMLNFNGRGSADHIEVSETNGLLMEGLSFSSCPEFQKDWEIKADGFQIRPDDAMAVTRGTRFYVRGVPVFYLPYFSFPATNLRQSGLLFPTFSNRNRTGFSYEQPYYFNIAPQIDATVTPRLMSSSGLQLKTEFRYLTAQNNGQLQLEYINDKQFDSDDSGRYFARLSHRAQIDQHWQLDADLNVISDNNYITDFGSDIYSRTDTHLPQRINLSYISEKLLFEASLNDFAVLGDHQTSYRTLPELSVDYDFIRRPQLTVNLMSELSHFQSRDQQLAAATRLHIEPTITLPFRKAWGEIIAESKFFHTAYRQRGTETTGLDKHVTRSIFQGQVSAKLNFERKVEIFGRNITQSLEPKLQYLYTDRVDQSNIGIYDSTPMLNDFHRLFSGREFTGLDRINHNNQLTLGVTSRLLNKDNSEFMSISLGQVIDFEQYRLDDVGAHTKDDAKSSLAAELSWNITPQWTLQSQIQLSEKNRTLEKNNITLDYRMGEGKLLQLSHRFVDQISDEKIEQTGIAVAWPISKNWHGVMRSYYDATQSRMIENYLGVQYSSCCWTVQISGGKSLVNRYNNDGTIQGGEFDNTFNINFSFTGLGSNTGYVNLLRNGLFGYYQPYLRN